MRALWPAIPHKRLGLPALAVVSLGFGFGASVASAAVRCPAPDDPPEVAIAIEPGKVVYRTEQSRSNLKRIQQSHGGAVTAQGWYPLGLTVAEFQVKMRTGVKVHALRRRRFCGVPSRVVITMGYPQFTIYIARRYRRGTCEYRVVRKHEENHVRIYRENLRRFLPRLRRKLVQAAEALEPIVVSAPDDAAAEMQADLAHMVDPLIDELKRSASEANSEIDTVEHYGELWSRCDNWD